MMSKTDKSVISILEGENILKKISVDNPLIFNNQIQFYSKLEANQIHPYINATSEAYMNQSLSVHNYILYITRIYNMTRNSEYITKIPIDIKNVLLKSSQSNKGFSKKLDELELGYISQYDWYCSKKIKSDKLANFCLVSLAKLLLTINNIFKKANLNKFGELWIQFFIAKIIGLEKTLTLINLRYLKPLIKYENDNDINLDDTRYEDGDELDSKVGDELDEANESVNENYQETGNEYNLDDVDVEKEDDELNQDNSYITVD
jgi:hypothetical protein